MLRPEDRQQFLTELRGVLQDLLSRYGGSEGIPFRIAFACYPREDTGS
jgi:hypothetical protein